MFSDPWCVHFFSFWGSPLALLWPQCPHSNPLANEDCVVLKGVSGGLCQATVLGLEDQNEHLWDIRDEEEETIDCTRRKRKGIVSTYLDQKWSLISLSAPFFFVFLSIITILYFLLSRDKIYTTDTYVISPCI